MIPRHTGIDADGVAKIEADTGRLCQFRSYKSKFPISFYEQIYRVMGWPFDAASTARTAYVGKLTNSLIYEQSPPVCWMDYVGKIQLIP
jgi:hypothetical protein